MNRLSTLLLLLVASFLSNGCAGPTALTVISIGAKIMAKDLIEARNRPGPIDVDDLLARARGELAYPDQQEVRLRFEPKQVEPDAEQRAWLENRLNQLEQTVTWQADVLAGPAATMPGSRAAFVAHHRAAKIGDLLGPTVRLRSVRYNPGLPADSVILSLRPARQESPRA